MFDPSGPLPPSVYWRRRAAAVVATIVAVVLLAWLLGGLIGDDGPGDPGAPNMAGMLTTRTSAPPSSPPSAPRSTKTSGTTTAPPTTTSSTPKPPITCSYAAIRVTAMAGAKHYQVGQHPLLKIAISNVGQVPCVRDISRKLRELIVVSGDGVHRLWSSNDCANLDAAKDTRLLQPGQKVSFSITWAGRTSAAGCPVHRTTVKAGKYFVVAKLGKLASRPVPLRLTA